MNAAPATPIKVTNGYHATQALPSVAPAELTPAAFPTALPASVGWEKPIGLLNTSKVAAFDAAIATSTYKAGGALEQAVVAASQLANSESKVGPHKTSSWGVFAAGSDYYVTPLWEKSLDDNKQRRPINIDQRGDGRGQAARTTTPEFVAAVGKSRWIDVRDNAPKPGTERVIGSVKDVATKSVTTVEADTSAKPVGQWNELYDAVREAAKLSEGADNPALALIRTGHDTISAFPLTGTPQGGGASEPLNLEGAEADELKAFKRAVDGPQAKALRAIVDGRDFADYIRPSDVPGTAMFTAIGDMSAPGLPANARIVAKSGVGNHNGYGTIDAAIAGVRSATAGLDKQPAVLVREADGRIYTYEATGGYSKGNTFPSIDINPLFEGAIGTPNAGKVALTATEFKQYAMRMIGLVDGEFTWQHEG